MGNYTGKKPAKWELYKQDNDDSSMDLYMSNYAGSRQTPKRCPNKWGGGRVAGN